MPKFKVFLTQMVEQVAEVEVEALDAAAAAALVQERVGSNPFEVQLPGHEGTIAVPWREGEDAGDVRVYLVRDDSGEDVWDWG